MSDLVIGGVKIKPGENVMIDIPLPQLYTHTPMTLPVHVIRGKRRGPRLFVSAAIHGDELNGIEIVRRLLKSRTLKHLRGSLLAIPIVNIYGVLNHSRYLPDRRDLNRSFPGSKKGSMAARLAEVFMREIVANCTHGIDLHTGAINRSNLPQIRANLECAETERLARSFGVPVMLNSDLRDGSLREAAAEAGVPMLLYEAGEALRLDEVSIRAGLIGIIKVMRAIGMLPPSRSRKTPKDPFVARSSSWVRAPESGLLRPLVHLGALVERDDLLATIADPFTSEEVQVRSPCKGIIIGRTHIPLVHEGEALYHIGRFGRATDEVAETVEAFQNDIQPDTSGNGRPGVV